MIRARTSTGVKAIAALRLRDAGGVKAIANVRVRDASNVLRLVYSSSTGGAFTVTAVPLVAFGGRTGGGPLSITSEEVSLSITGGAAPYSYAWELISAIDGTWTIESPTESKTRFVVNAVPLGDSYVATFKCVVTDARGASASSANIDVTCTNYGDLGGILP